jgi:flavin-dependent dehydrogenase
MTPRVVVVGGSVAGLSTALFLARRGIPATVLEKDATPTPSSSTEAGSWRRRPTPQAAHSHAFLARSRQILAAEAPSVLTTLADAGVRSAALASAPPSGLGPLEPEDGDDELVVLNARRSTFEWALRRAAQDHPDVDLRLGVGVTGLDVHVNGSSTVTGVVTDDGPIAADVVVDAAGKRSPVRSWADVPPGPDDRDVACGITYLTRFYRLLDDEPTPLNRGYTHGASFDRYSCLVFPGDDGAFSITFGVLPEDREIVRALRDPAGFDAAVAAIDDIAPWGAPETAEPTSDVAVMAGLHNLLRVPTTAEPLGLHVVGDARCVTNPAHTRGTTLALVAAQRLASVVASHPTDAHAQADAMAAFTTEELAPWVEDSVGQDADRLARWRPEVEPEPPRWRHRLSNGQAYQAAQRDPGAWRAFVRLQNTLARPADVLDSPSVAAAVDAVAASGWSAPRSSAPDHDELIALARAAAAS